MKYENDTWLKYLAWEVFDAYDEVQGRKEH